MLLKDKFIQVVGSALNVVSESCVDSGIFDEGDNYLRATKFLAYLDSNWGRLKLVEYINDFASLSSTFDKMCIEHEGICYILDILYYDFNVSIKYILELLSDFCSENIDYARHLYNNSLAILRENPLSNKVFGISEYNSCEN